MIPGDSTDRPGFKQVKARRFAYLNAESTNPSLVRILERSRSLTSFLRTIVNGRKRDPYLDTGESGETYDAEMEAAAIGI